MTLTPLAADNNVNPLIPHWSEVILVLIIFGILYFLVWKFVVPQFEATFAARRDAIEGGMERADAAQAEAQAALRQYQTQLAGARNDAAQIRENARAEAQHIVDDLRQQAQEESSRIVARGQVQLETQRSQVVRELRGEVGTLAVQLAERIVGERLSDDAQVRATVDSFVTELESDATASAEAGTATASPAAGGDRS
jgi:F-type H+-transporting ATPase subunit b